MKTKVALIYAALLILLSAAVVSAAPNAPDGVVASNGRYTDRIEVNWDPVPNAEFYRIYRSSEDNPDLRVILGAWQAETHFVDRAAEHGRRHFYWIKVSDGNQTSEFGIPGSGYLKVATLASAAVEVRDPSDVHGVRLVWDQVLGAAFSRVYRGARSDTASAVPISDWITAAEFRDMKASPGVGYHYWVKTAFDVRGMGESSFAAAVRGKRALASPTSPTVVSGPAEAVVVKWNGAVGARFYRVYRSTQPYAATAVPIGGWIDAAEFVDQTAVVGTQYYYWVKASASDSNRGASAFSSPTSGVRGLSQPTAIELTVVEGGLGLRWNEVEGAVAYRVYRGTNPYAAESVPVGDWLEAVSFTDETATPGVRYHYWVKAAVSRSGQRESAFSAAAEGLLSLAAPIALEAVLTAGRVLLQWDEVVGGTHYQVYRNKRLDAEGAEVIAPWQTATTLVDDQTVPGVRYYYWVKAAKGTRGQLAGEFGVRASSFRTMAAPGQLNTSQGLFADRVELSWGAVTGASYYRVYRSTSPDPTFHIPLGDWQRSTQYMDLGTQPGVRYYYWVKAAPMVDGRGASAFSAFSSGFLGDTVLPAPAQVAATDGDFSDKVEIVWPEVTGGSHYRIYRSAQADSSTALPLAGWQRTAAFVDQQVVPGAVYYYWVKVATDGAGENASRLGALNSGYRALVSPSAVQATAGRLREIEVVWEPTEGAGFFRVYRSTTPSPSRARVLSGWQVDTRFVDRSAMPGMVYYYWVKASPQDNGLNASVFGEEASGYRALGAPSGLVLAGEAALLRLQWEPVTGAAYYQVLRSEQADVRRAEQLGVWQRSTEFEDRTALPGITYNYWVKAAVDAVGERASTSSAMLDDYRRVAGPVLHEVSQGDRDRVALAWSPVAGASHYQVWRSISPFSATAQLLGDWQMTTEFSDESAGLGVTYHYWVKAAVDSEGARPSGFSAVASGYKGLAEITPLISAENAVQLDLSWEEVAGAVAYRVYRSERLDARQSAPLMDWRSATEFSDATALPGVTYYYWVRAAADSEGLNATPLGVAVSGHRVLSDAGSLRVSRGDLDGVDLAWVEVPGATHYMVYRGLEENTSEATAVSSWVSAMGFSDDTALPGVTYYYWVRSATSALGHKAGSFGSVVQGYRGMVVPGGILGSTGDPQTISIGWHRVEGATHYQVYRTHDIDNVLAEPVSAWQEALFFFDTATQPGVNYHYWVRAAVGVDGVNASRFSEAVTANRGLFAPEVQQIVSGRLDGVALEWQSVEGASHYRVYRGLGGDLQGAELLTDWREVRQLVDDSAEPGVVYTYWVQAAAGVDGDNSSAPGPGIEGFRGLEAPGQPDATTGEVGRVRLGWSAVPGAQYYRVLRSMTDDPLGATPGDWLAELAHTDEDVLLGETYYYWIQAATNSAGAIASDLSAAIRGYEALPAPSNLQVNPDGNTIELSWDSNSQFDMLRYRIYAGIDSASVSLIDSVAATELSFLRVDSVLPLPSRFNLSDMGLSVLDRRSAISARFTELVGRTPTEAEVDELFTGRKLERATAAPLNSDSRYYFEIVPVNAQGREGTRGNARVVSVSTVSLVVTGGDERIEINWSPVWGAGAYRLYRHSSDVVEGAAPLGAWQEGTVFADTSAKRGQDYYYWLQMAASLTETASGSFSQVASGSRSVAAPPLVAASKDLADRIKLEWYAGEGAEVFRVYHHRDNDPTTATPVSEWLNENTFEHLGAAPGENYYWIQAASDVGGEHISALSAVSTGQRGPLTRPTDLEATWGEFKDRVVVSWKREPGVSHVQIYSHTSPNSSEAVARTDWVPWNGFEDLEAAPDQIHYYWVRGASSATGEHATGLSAFTRGFRSGDLFAPTGLATMTTPGKIFLSWEPNPETVVARYRIYAGTLPGELTLVDSVQADADPRVIIRDIVPLPASFNVVDLGLNIQANSEAVANRFEEFFGYRPSSVYLDQLFSGQSLDKDKLISLEAGKTYYFKVAAVDANANASMPSQPAEITVLADIAGKVVTTEGEIPAATGIEPNAPNPFNASTLIRFQLSAAGSVRVRIYNALGQVMRDLVEGEYAAGHYAVSWDGRNRNGVEAASGMYFYVLETEQGIWPRRMLLLR